MAGKRVEPLWMAFYILGSEWEQEEDLNAAPDAPESKRCRYRPRAYTGEPEPRWLPGCPPVLPSENLKERQAGSPREPDAADVRQADAPMHADAAFRRIDRILLVAGAMAVAAFLLSLMGLIASLLTAA